MASEERSEEMSEEEVDLWMQALDGLLSQPGSTTVEASEVQSWLLLGGKPAAEDAFRGNCFGVTHILNCCEPWCADGPNADNLEYVGFEAYDEVEFDLLGRHYGKAKLFLQAVRDSCAARCLVHCAMGVNRSACICVAFLVDAEGMQLLDALDLVKRSRGCILGNHGFRRQLIHFAHARSLLGDVGLRDAWAAQAPAPERVVTVEEPPLSWRQAQARASPGRLCRVRLYGDWYEAEVTEVSGAMACVRYTHDGSDDWVEAAGPDLVCMPDVPGLI